MAFLSGLIGAIAIWAALSLLTALVLAAAAAAGDAALEAERRRESTTPENERATMAGHVVLEEAS